MAIKHYRLMLVLFMAYFLFVAFAHAACGSNDPETGSVVGGTTLPSTRIIGTDPDATLLFEGRQWRLADVLPADQRGANELQHYREVGTTRDASVALEGGEVKIYKLDKDDDAIWTPPLTPQRGGSENTQLWLRWVPRDVTEQEENEDNP